MQPQFAARFVSVGPLKAPSYNTESYQKKLDALPANLTLCWKREFTGYTSASPERMFEDTVSLEVYQPSWLQRQLNRLGWNVLIQELPENLRYQEFFRPSNEAPSQFAERILMILQQQLKGIR